MSKKVKNKNKIRCFHVKCGSVGAVGGLVKGLADCGGIV